MNLIIDIGNTIAKMAVFDGGRIVEVVYDSNLTLERLPEVCRTYTIEKAIVATVIDLSREVLSQLEDMAVPILWLNEKTSLPVENLYETPRTLGYDRMAAVVGANEQFPGRDILVIDAGTCITYEFVDAAARYHGGNISPGLQMRFKALHQFTGRLPMVALEGRMVPMGKDTDTAIRAGGKMLQRGTPKLGKDGKPMKDKRGKVIYEPYRIKVLNTINFKKSMHYNPFAYIHSEKDILKLVTTLIANTKGEGKAGDDFWVKAETLLYCALIGYIHYEAPVEEQNFSTLIEFINAMEVREDDEEFKNPVDLMFDALEAEKPNHFAVRQYKKYKLAAGKTAKSILISCGARLAVFDIAELREVTSYDELELDTLGDRKTALFLIMSDTDDSFNFLISMCYTQLFNLLCEKADDVYGGRLPVHVRCLIDEAANIGQIPRLEKLVATIRSREISACLVLQAQSQLKAIYKDNADTIIGNMDTSIFLGGKEPTTLKELAAVLGKETIDTYNTGDLVNNHAFCACHNRRHQRYDALLPV